MLSGKRATSLICHMNLYDYYYCPYCCYYFGCYVCCRCCVIVLNYNFYSAAVYGLYTRMVDRIVS